MMDSLWFVIVLVLLAVVSVALVLVLVLRREELRDGRAQYDSGRRELNSAESRCTSR